MADEPILQPEAADIFMRLDALGRTQKELADLLGIEPNKISKARKGERQFKASEVLLARDWLSEVTSMPRLADEDGEPLATVGIQHIDQAYGLGATFTDNHVTVDVLQFPKIWVDSITSSPPALLTWARGKGDSMEPTIRDGDLVLIDRSQRRIEEQDAMWAYTVGDLGAIKRLRVKGDRVQIYSDNPHVPDDEELIDFVNIVGRVIFVGMRK